jgi:hypothetical protein
VTNDWPFARIFAINVLQNFVLYLYLWKWEQYTKRSLALLQRVSMKVSLQSQMGGARAGSASLDLGQLMGFYAGQ